MIKSAAKYVLAPGVGVGMLVSLGLFDPMTSGAGPSGALTGTGDPGAYMLASLAGPLAVARRIAATGLSALGLSPDQLPAFLTGGGVSGTAHAVGGGVPVAARKTAAAPVAEAGATATDAAWRPSRPPAPAD